jgi:enamine deaminase RidA (YjgF/YER057c/UK114 family)
MSAMKTHNPSTVAAPFGTYAHGIEVETPARVLYGAGQVGVDADGRAGEGIEEQSHLVWRNVREVLAAADMGIGHIVRLGMYLVSREDLAIARAVREEVLGDHRPASTLVFVAGLASPELLIEVDFIAVR